MGPRGIREHNERARETLDDYGPGGVRRTPAPPEKRGVPAPDTLAPGTRLTFRSPLFNCLCTAKVAMAAGESVFVTDHSIMGDTTPCVIQRAWIVEEVENA